MSRSRFLPAAAARGPRGAPRPGGPARGRAFTLIELLVVVAIIALLLTILTPSIERARQLALSARCRHNLHEIGQAFLAAAGMPNAPAPAYPEPNAWPAVPMNAVSTPGIYVCPKGPDAAEAGGNVYQIYVKSVDAYIPFGENYYCHVEDHGDVIRYRFEVYTGLDWNDAIFDVTRTSPRVATFSYDSHITPGVALRLHGEDVPGWEELSPAQFGKSITFGGGLTNYGYNARAAGFATRPGMVVVLDYDRLVANYHEDLGVYLRSSARHLGRLNALMADGSVRDFGPSDLDPGVRAEAAEFWSP